MIVNIVIYAVHAQNIIFLQYEFNLLYILYINNLTTPELSINQGFCLYYIIFYASYNL
jgi:hypothetical protein